MIDHRELHQPDLGRLCGCNDCRTPKAREPATVTDIAAARQKAMPITPAKIFSDFGGYMRTRPKLAPVVEASKPVFLGQFKGQVPQRRLGIVIFWLCWALLMVALWWAR